jgi:hypothetical protein
MRRVMVFYTRNSGPALGGAGKSLLITRAEEDQLLFSEGGHGELTCIAPNGSELFLTTRAIYS